jgi:predicted flap endonuclease-1-like 5' DNA nuclease
MFRILGLFDPGWRDFSVRVSNTEITLIWILAALLGALLYHLFFARKGSGGGIWETRFQSIEKEIQDERQKHHKTKSQLEAAMSRSTSFAASAHELEKVKVRIHELQKELEQARKMSDKYKLDFDNEHAKVTSMMVDHSEVESLRNRVRNQEKDLMKSRTDQSNLRAELDAANSARVRLSASLDESQVVEMTSKIQRLENDLQSSRLMVIKYQTEAGRMEEERRKATEGGQQGADHQKETDSLRARVAELEAEHLKAKQEVAGLSGLKTEVEALRKEKADRETADASRASEAGAAAGLQEKLNALEAGSRTLQAKLGEAEASRDQLSAELASLREALKNAEEKAHTAAAAVVATAPVVPDDLKVIEGIGPKLEEILNGHDIWTYRQLASTPVAQLQAILDKAGEAYRIHDPGTWPLQSGLLAEGKLEEFRQLTDELKGGRRVD